MKIKNIIRIKKGLRVIANIEGKTKRLRCGQQLTPSSYISEINLNENEKSLVIKCEETNSEERILL